MRGVIKKLHDRELSACSFSNHWPFPALRSFSLFKIMPPMAQEDIFLGFTACDSFLVSYRAEFKRYVLRFWLFPPSSHPSDDKPNLSLFADICFSRITYTSQFHEAPCVRFIQSALRPEMFFFLSCDYDGTGLVTSFASMPDLNCSFCMAYCNALDTPQGTSMGHLSRCIHHGRVLLLNLDLTPSPLSPFHFSQPDPTGDHIDSCLGSTPSSFIPPCYQSKGYPPRSERKQNKCHCFFSTNSLIGQVQVGVCPISGCLKLAWPSPDSQIKVLSCYFEHRAGSPESAAAAASVLCSLPVNVPVQATSGASDQQLFAFHDPLLTHNYCSTCYSWPDITHQFTPPPFASLSSSIRENSCIPPPALPLISRRHIARSTSSHPQCLFTCQSAGVQYIPEPTRWTETRHGHHRRQSFAYHNDGNTTSDEVVVQTDTKPVSCSCSKQLLPPRDILPSILLTSRPSVFSCHRSTYLAMLQDIRASYIHWNLVARPTQSHSSYHTQLSTSLLPASVNFSDGDSTTPTQSDRPFLASHSSSINSSGTDQLTTHTSPVFIQSGVEEETSSNGAWLSSEDLLAHRLSGQCHTSFDLTDWQEVTVSRFPSAQSAQPVVHLEEVVFDIPMQSDVENVDRPPTGLLVLLPLEEPNLLLIYSCQPHRKSRPAGHHRPSSLCLISAIDLRTGRRVPLPTDTELDLVSFVSRQHLTAAQLRSITRHCPMATCPSGDSLLHELNNYHMVCNSDSLKVLRSRQGGYAVHW